jgi:hypothetical protein
MQSGNLNFLEPSGPLRACNGTALPFFYLYVLNENVKNTIYVLHRRASEIKQKTLSRTEICFFVQALPLRLSDLTVLRNMY